MAVVNPEINNRLQIDLQVKYDNEQELIKANKHIGEVMKNEWAIYLDKIYPLMRKPSIFYDWYLLSDLSYTPDED